jgi:hypothetical protein
MGLKHRNAARLGCKRPDGFWFAAIHTRAASQKRWSLESILNKGNPPCILKRDLPCHHAFTKCVSDSGHAWIGPPPLRTITITPTRNQIRRLLRLMRFLQDRHGATNHSNSHRNSRCFSNKTWSTEVMRASNDHNHKANHGGP